MFGDDASGYTEWTSEAEQTLAMMYYAAHLLQLSILRGMTPTGQLITSERIRDLSLTYKNPGTDIVGELGLTIYGVHVRRLIDCNFPAVLTVGSAIRM